MKLSCLQENLSKALAVVSRAVATRPTLPITSNILLATDNGRLKLAATNLEIAITQWIGATIEEEGAITVPARLLSDFVNSLPNEKIQIAFSPAGPGRSLQLNCARFEARITGMDAEDFPPIPDVEQSASVVTVQMQPDTLKKAIGRVVFAAATEDSRPVLTGVSATFEGSVLTLAAADGFRLSVDKAPLIGSVAEKITTIIPARAMSEVTRLIGDSQEPITIAVNQAKSQIVFKADKIRLTSQLIQGTFPNYNQLIPADHVTRTFLDVESFLRATRAAAIFARDASGIVRLQVQAGENPGAGKLIVSARAEELGDDLSEIDARLEGDDAKIAFNAKYLTDILSVIGKGEVILDTNSPSSPGLIRPVGEQDFVHVVMPMYVQW